MQTLTLMLDEGSGKQQSSSVVKMQTSEYSSQFTNPQNKQIEEKETNKTKRALWNTKPLDSTSKKNRKRLKVEIAPLVTILESLDYCRNLICTQLERAENDGTHINASINGDSHVRRILYTLLPNVFIRTLLFETLKNDKNWSRIRPLFGAPPYSFLRPEDGSLLNASGFSHGRVNMAYKDVVNAANYSQFGHGHLEDQFGREYCVVAPDDIKSTDLLHFDLKNKQSGALVLMYVKIRRTPNLQDKRSKFFPSVGENLQLKHTSTIQELVGMRQQDTYVVTVKQISIKNLHSATARITVRCR